ncbi:hypothetical protein [Curvibacter delicatus]|jgi:DNA-binding transcriptional ArsR family regulator|uniref:hypothetical protein n=1 Tax=Curvibacter delicatus TaxID=80879 RepID=UPI000832F197|nr:hypothetical protein [Curvibacter delicatus]
MNELISGSHSTDEEDARPIRREIGFEPDGKWRDWWVKVVTGHTLRDLRGNIMGLAYVLARSKHPQERAVCVLSDTRITPERLSAEIRLVNDVMRPDIASRIAVVQRFSDGRISDGFGIDLQFKQWLDDLVRHEGSRPGIPGATQQSVFSLLILNWLKHEGALTRSAIQESAGASYPTVANVLAKLQGMGILEPRSDKRVELKRFPWEEWSRWVVGRQEDRKTVVFSSPGGHGRTPEEMARRLTKLGRDDIAVGGVLGAKRYYPKLDISGSVRLDLTVKGTEKSADLGFIRQLDAGLVRATEPGATGAIAVHFLGTRADSRFEMGEDGTLWADPVECLADLYELRLDAQAKEMLNAMIEDRKRKQSMEHHR